METRILETDMARLRRLNGTYRRTTVADFGNHACAAFGRFYPQPEPQRDEGGFTNPITRPGVCPHCGSDPGTTQRPLVRTYDPDRH